VKFDNTPFENCIAIYPQPIAMSCVRICRAGNSYERLDAILKCAETVTRYLAAAAICSFSAREDLGIAVPKGLSDFTGNLSFGHFLTAVQAIASINTSHPLKEALTAAFKRKEGGSEPADTSLITLLKLRNQLGHGLMSISEAKATSIFKEQSPDEGHLDITCLTYVGSRSGHKTSIISEVVIPGGTSPRAASTVQSRGVSWKRARSPQHS